MLSPLRAVTDEKGEGTFFVTWSVPRGLVHVATSGFSILDPLLLL